MAGPPEPRSRSLAISKPSRNPGRWIQAQDGRFSYLEGQIIAPDGIEWNYVLEAASFHDEAEPDDIALLNGMICDSVTPEIADVDYATFCHRMVPGVRALAATGDWYRPHPWLSVFLPLTSTERYLAAVLDALAPNRIGPLPMLVYPIRRGRAPAPRLRTPSADDGLFYSFSVLRTTTDDPQEIALALDQNRELAQKALERGGTIYGISAVPHSCDIPIA